MSEKRLPEQARVVIIGGGVIGCSIAYHLTRLGWRDVLLLERDQLTSGTTWHAAGLITTLRHTENQTRLAKYTQELYQSLEAETGLSTGFSQIGSIQLACTPEREEELRRGCDMARCFDVEFQELSPAEVLRHWPLADVSDVRAAFYFPNDGRANPTDLTQSLARGARQGGATILEGVPVQDVLTRDGRVSGVRTEEGQVRCEYVVNCAGMWARELGLKSGVSVPLQAAEHYYLVTEPMAGLDPQMPILRDPDRRAYLREEAGKLMIGLFEDVAAPWARDGVPADFSFRDLPPNWDRMTPYLETAMQRIPACLEAGIQMFFCGPESFTPDHHYLMGEAPGLKGYFVAAGFNSLGILSAGGVGQVMAQWIAEGYPPMDVFDVGLRRMQPFQNGRRYLQDRTVESLGLVYRNNWPFRQFETARDVRRLVLHDRLLAAGACMGEAAGWERPNWYAAPGDSPCYEYSFGRQNWFERVASEHRAVRERVGLFEMSSFCKLLVQGRDAVRSLNWICTNDVDVVVGRSVYTQFLNERGGIEADLTVTRLGACEFLVVTAAFTASHVLNWLRDHIGDEECTTVTDISGALGMLNIQGPESRALLASVSEHAFDTDSFPFATMQEVEIGYCQVRALRITYCGELGWELYVPTEYLQQVYDRIVASGNAHGLQHCGYHALNSLRIEKAYREFAHDIGGDDSPVEAGLAFTCKTDKERGFLGMERFLARKAAGTPQRRLVQFLLEDPEPLLYHAEPIYLDGEIVGHTTSAMYGHTLGASVALGYVSDSAGVSRDVIEQGRFEIAVAGRRYPARASLRPLYDPDGQRPRA
jgi:glycine cleavage system aminomethyltransferase T/glycine/D-amino acid oxidase-like deaminating enzyme